MNLTKRKALEECIKMWTWLSECPGADKDDYFMEMEINDKPHSDCYCCEYAINNWGFRNCNCCPIWEGAANPRDGCSHPDSPYYKWCNTEIKKGHKQYSKDIVKLAQKALDELDKEE